MSKIDFTPQEIIFMANVLNATPFRLGDAAVAIEIFKKITPFIPQETKKETN